MEFEKHTIESIISYLEGCKKGGSTHCHGSIQAYRPVTRAEIITEIITGEIKVLEKELEELKTNRDGISKNIR